MQDIGGGESSLTGFNKAQIESLRGSIASACTNSATSISNTLTDKIVTPMSSAWYAPEAKSFFEAFKATVESCSESIMKTFDSFRFDIQNSANAWEQSTKAFDISGASTGTTEASYELDLPSWYGGDNLTADGASMEAYAGSFKLDEIPDPELTISVDSISEVDDAGNVRIDESAATTIASQLSDVRTTISTELASIATELSADAAFLGHEQAAAISNCFTALESSVEKIFAWLTEGDGTDGNTDGLRGAIDGFVKKYAAMAEGVATSYNTSADNLMNGTSSSSPGQPTSTGTIGSMPQ